MEEGVTRYTESELKLSAMNLKKTVFMWEPFSIIRTYLAAVGKGNSSEPILAVVKRVGTFEINESLSIKVFQHAPSLFHLDFLNGGKTSFSLSINEKQDPYKKYLNIIKECPLIFYDLDGLKETFEEVKFKSANKNVGFSLKFEKWKNSHNMATFEKTEK